MTHFDLSQRAAIVAEMIKALREVGSWCGETHIQKSVYLLQSAGEVDLGYDFVLYKHGPYSFDLATDIASLRSANIVEFIVPIQGYGPSVQLTVLGNKVFEYLRGFVRPYMHKIKFIAEWFGRHDVRYLERVATAHYVKLQHPSEEPYGLASKLRGLKPHISEPDALAAVHQLNEKLGALKERRAERWAS